PEQIVDLVWTPDSGRLVAITHQAGFPARARVFLMDVGAETRANATELVLLPAEVIPGSALPDPSGRWLALVTHAAVAPGGRDVLDLGAPEVHVDGSFRGLADLGAAPRLPGPAAITWAPATTDGTSDSLAFAAPV